MEVKNGEAYCVVVLSSLRPVLGSEFSITCEDQRTTEDGMSESGEGRRNSAIGLVNKRAVMGTDQTRTREKDATFFTEGVRLDERLVQITMFFLSNVRMTMSSRGSNAGTDEAVKV